MSRVGYTLFFSTNRAVMYMTLKGRIFPLLHLERPLGVLLSALCDRIVLAFAAEAVPPFPPFDSLPLYSIPFPFLRSTPTPT